MDIVYVVRPGEINEELRYSLRSLRNLPHDEVWIVGHKPRWVKGVRHIPTVQRGPKWDCSTANLKTACKHPGVSDRFAYFNDDFFVLHPVNELLLYNRGPLDQVLGYYGSSSSRYADGMRGTARMMRALALDEPFVSYELHAPMPVHKDGMLEVIEVAEQRPVGVLHKRTLYGNYWRLGGLSMDDCKVLGLRSRFPADWLFVSTTDTLFRRGLAGQQIRALFPDPSPYEHSMLVRPARPSRFQRV